MRATCKHTWCLVNRQWITKEKVFVSFNVNTFGWNNFILIAFALGSFASSKNYSTKPHFVFISIKPKIDIFPPLSIIVTYFGTESLCLFWYIGCEDCSVGFLLVFAASLGCSEVCSMMISIIREPSLQIPTCRVARLKGPIYNRVSHPLPIEQFSWKKGEKHGVKDHPQFHLGDLFWWWHFGFLLNLGKNRFLNYVVMDKIIIHLHFHGLFWGYVPNYIFFDQGCSFKMDLRLVNE